MNNPIMYAEINELLQALVMQIQSILKNELIGVYIGGSLASNNFDCETSDIDCYIITTNGLSKNVLTKIEEMHKQFYSSKLHYAKKIEASYIPHKDILNVDSNSMRPYFNEGHFHLAQYGSNYVIELHVLRENGVTIVGPEIKNLIKELSPQNLKQAVKRNLNEYWKNILQDIPKLNRSDYQVFAILTMCRTLYSLETGLITSKLVAAQWALQKLDSHRKNLIEQAIVWCPDQEINKLDETRTFIKYVISKSHDYK